VNENGISWPAVETLARKTRVSERQVHRILGVLERAGHITIGFREGPMQVNVYKVLMVPSCQGDIYDTGGVSW